MSGISHGTHLDQLRDLEHAVQVQIELEEIRVARGRATRRGTAYPSTNPGPAVRTDSPPRDRPSRTVVVPVEHVSTPVIREWARQHGYTPHRTGVLDQWHVSAFIEAHQ